MAVWVGVKIDIAINVFWAVWGRRANNRFGLRLEQQTEVKNGVTSSLAVNANAPIPGEFTISSAMAVFGGVPWGVPTQSGGD